MAVVYLLVSNQGGAISGITNYANVGGIYESDAIRSNFALTFTPMALLLSVKDVAGAGVQEQAFYNIKDSTGFYYFVGARQQNATVTGDYFVIGKA